MSGTPEINDGGPAFPVSFTETSCYMRHGMSLRDWFAGQALAGLISTLSNVDVFVESNRRAKEMGLTIEQMHSDKAVQYADALIAARQGGAS